MNDSHQTRNAGSRVARLRDFFSLERNVTTASGAVFLLGFGEELWKKFLPKYLEALGASVPLIGLFGTAEDFLDAVYQYPGGWIADRFGRRNAFFLFLGLATRLATLPILGSIMVIQLFVYPSAWTENLVWASILVFLLTRGPGALSLDHLIERYFASRG